MTRHKSEIISLEFPEDKWPLTSRKLKQAWGDLERMADDNDCRILYKSKRIVCHPGIIALECDVVPR